MRIVLFLIALCSALEAEVVLITGAGQGLGLAIAQAFLNHGWEVYGTARTPMESGPIRYVQLDVTDARSIHKAVRQVLESAGRIDVLVNNAGYGLIGTEEMVEVEEVKALFDVNVFGVLRMVQEVLPVMRAQKKGHIINISSTSGIRAIPALGMYAASKFALEGMTEALAANVAPWNIRATLVVPGTVSNDWAKHCKMGSRSNGEPFYQDLSERILDRLIAFAPGGQSPAEIAELIVSLVGAKKCDLRVVTSEKVESVVRKKLVDPSGNALHKEQLALIETVLND